jgi:hypothetical protein
MVGRSEQVKERILVLAPIGREAGAGAEQGDENDFCRVDLRESRRLASKLREGGALALVAEEAFYRGRTLALEQWVANCEDG